MRTKEEILKQMEEQMPFEMIGKGQMPYILEAMEIYAQEQVKNITYEPVLATGRKTRADRRNEKAELVCRESRYQLYKHGGIVDNRKLSDLVIDWLKYGRKICYKPL